MSNFKILTEAEIGSELKDLVDWQVEDNTLKTQLVFKDFKQAFAFMNLVAMEAEKMNHHPEWINVYNKLTVKLSTHEAGDKITDLDISLAKYISRSSLLFSRN